MSGCAVAFIMIRLVFEGSNCEQQLNHNYSMQL